MTNKRFATNGYYINDTYHDGRKWLVNEVEVKEIVDIMNGLDTKARESRKTISKLQKENNKLKEENEQLRLELETHKHPLWSTREAERKVNKLADSLADEVKKNGLLNEEINRLRIENMRLKKKGSDE